MYATLRRYQTAPGSMNDLLHEVDTGFAELIQELDGFIGYECLDCGGGTLVTISTFRDHEAAEASTPAAAEWIRNNLADYELTRLDVTTGEVAVSRASTAMLEPAHR
jgi:hypothetical protein